MTRDHIGLISILEKTPQEGHLSVIENRSHIRSVNSQPQLFHFTALARQVSVQAADRAQRYPASGA